MKAASKGRNIYLDLFKFFLCYLVIAIHLSGESYSFFPLYRLAVPMFFMISGYFNFSSDRDRLYKKSVVFIKRTLRYMLVGFAIYIIFDFVMCYVDGRGVGYYFTTLFYEDFLLEFFLLNRPITYTGAQLWFLIALFVVSLIHHALVRFDRVRYYKIIIPVCYLIYFFFAGYMYLFQDTDMPIRYTRNALFFGLPNFALGYTLAKHDFHKRAWYKYVYLAVGVGCFFAQIAEYNLVKTPNISLEMYVTGVISAAALLLFFLGLRHGDAAFYYKWVGKNASFYVYILHMAVSVVLAKLVTFENLLIKSLWVLIISFAVYEAAYLISLLVKRLTHKEKNQQQPLQ